MTETVMVRVSEEILEEYRSLYPELKGLTYTAIVQVMLRKALTYSKTLRAKLKKALEKEP